MTNTYRFTAYLMLFSLLLFTTMLSGQTFTGAQAEELVPGAEKVLLNQAIGTPSFVLFTDDSRVNLEDYDALERNLFRLSDETSFKIVKEESDEKGQLHQIRQQLYQGVPIEGAFSTIHSLNGEVTSFNGTVFPRVQVELSNLILAKEARNTVLVELEIQPIIWQYVQFSSKHLLLKNERAEFEREKIDLSIVYAEDEFQPVWTVQLNSLELLIREKQLVDARSGKLVGTIEEGQNMKEKNGVGTVIVRSYEDYGFQIISTSYNTETNRYELRDAENRSFGAITQTAVELSFPLNYISKINDNWNATDVKANATAFWALQETFNAYSNLFGRDGIDGLSVYLQNVSSRTRYVKCDGSNEDCFQSDQDYHLIRFNTGASGVEDDQNTLDIIAHEYAHGIAEASLFKQNSNPENDGINEAFCDIMGKLVEWEFEERKYGIEFPDEDSDAARWTIGEEAVGFSRSIQDPGQDEGFTTVNTQIGCCDDEDPESYDAECCRVAMENAGSVFENQPSPDTYGTDNTCGTYIGSNRSYPKGGVLRKWFYLLGVGDTGTNSCGNDYSVCGIGVELAGRLLYATVNNGYLNVPGVSYNEFRNATLAAANEFTNISTDEVNDAWYAVGVGNRPEGYVIAVDNGPSPVVVTAGESFTYTSSFVGSQNHEPTTVCYTLSTDNVLSNDDTQIGSAELVFYCSTSITANLVIPENTLPGNFTLFIDADCDDEYDGNNPGPEVIGIDVQVAGGEKPDLAVLSTNPAYENFPPSVLRGQVINLSATVNNQGLNAAGNFWLKMFIRPINQLASSPSSTPVSQMGTVVSQRRVFGLAANQSFTANFNFTVPSNYALGEHVVFFVADAVTNGNGEVEESNEDNNVGLGHFNVRYNTGGGGSDCKFPCRPEKSIGNQSIEPYFSLSPNPARATSPIQIGYQPSLTENLLVSITDLHGRTSHQYELLPQQQSGNFRADINRLPVGTYVVTLQSSGQIISQRLMIQ